MGLFIPFIALATIHKRATYWNNELKMIYYNGSEIYKRIDLFWTFYSGHNNERNCEYVSVHTNDWDDEDEQKKCFDDVLKLIRSRFTIVDSSWEYDKNDRSGVGKIYVNTDEVKEIDIY